MRTLTIEEEKVIAAIPMSDEKKEFIRSIWQKEEPVKKGIGFFNSLLIYLIWPAILVIAVSNSFEGLMPPAVQKLDNVIFPVVWIMISYIILKNLFSNIAHITEETLEGLLSLTRLKVLFTGSKVRNTYVNVLMLLAVLMFFYAGSPWTAILLLIALILNVVIFVFGITIALMRASKMEIPIQNNNE